MSDIIMELPYYCDDCETWHRDFIWAYDDGTYTRCDSDGDHEGIEQSDIPSSEENAEEWYDYAEWVAEHGQDPLGNFYVAHTVKTTEFWNFKLTKTLVGPRLLEAELDGRDYTLGELPEHVTSFLQLDASGKLGDFATWQDLVDVLPAVRPNEWFPAKLEYDKPRDAQVVKHELRELASFSLKRT